MAGLGVKRGGLHPVLNPTAGPTVWGWPQDAATAQCDATP